LRAGLGADLLAPLAAGLPTGLPLPLTGGLAAAFVLGLVVAKGLGLVLSLVVALVLTLVVALAAGLAGAFALGLAGGAGFFGAAVWLGDLAVLTVLEVAGLALLLLNFVSSSDGPQHEACHGAWSLFLCLESAYPVLPLARDQASPQVVPSSSRPAKVLRP